MDELLGRGAENETSRCLLILGMHRSGTSAWTRLLNLSGVELGHHLLGANSGNEEGHWESQEAIALNTAIMAALGMDWHTLDRIHPDSFSLPLINAFVPAVEKFLGQFHRQSLWGIKEPRLCRLLPLWKPLIKQYSSQINCVLVLRHPYEVALSLQKRDGMNVNHGLMLWLLHVLESEYFTRGDVRLFVDYKNIFVDPVAEISRVVDVFGLPVDISSEPLRAKLSEFVRPDLRHHCDACLDNVDLLDEQCAFLAIRTYEIFSVAIQGDGALDTEALDVIHQTLALRFPVTEKDYTSLIFQNLPRAGQSFAEEVLIQTRIDSSHHLYPRRKAVAESILKASYLIQQRVQFNNVEGALEQAGQFGSVADIGKLLQVARTLNTESVSVNRAYDQYQKLLTKLSYSRWLRLNPLREGDAQFYAERMVRHWQHRPKFHLLLTGSDDAVAINATIESLSLQLYRNWTVSLPIVDGLMLEHLDVGDGYDWLEKMQSPVTLKQSQLANEAEWIVIIPAGCCLQAHALFSFADYINLNQEWSFLYCDHDYSDQDGERVSVEFKPDCNLALLRSSPSFYGPLYTFKYDLAERLQDLDAINFDELIFHLTETGGVAGVGHIPMNLVTVPEVKTPDNGVFSERNKEIVIKHFAREGISADAIITASAKAQHVYYSLTDTPLVSVVIAARNRSEFINAAIDSLLEKTTYPNYEVVIIDGGSDDPDLIQWYASQSAHQKVRISQLAGDVSYSSLYNCGVYEAQGDFVVCITDDVQFVQPEWLDYLVATCQQTHADVVAPMVILPENKGFLDLGVQLGVGGIASSLQCGHAELELIEHSVSSVHGACFLVKREAFSSIRGLDESFKTRECGVLDFCLRLSQLGKQIIWTPKSKVVGHGVISCWERKWESSLRNSVHKAERDLILDRWLNSLANDPYYNRNQSLIVSDGSPEGEVPLPWDPNFRDRPRILGFPLPGASGDYRVILPLDLLHHHGLIQTGYIRLEGIKARTLLPVEVARLQPDVMVLQMSINDQQIEAIERYRRFNPGVFLVFVVDDRIDKVSTESSAYHVIQSQFRDGRRRLRKVLGLCHRLVVSTEPLADDFRDIMADIKVIPNYLQFARWGHLYSPPNKSGKPRVGWVGAQQHQGDLAILKDVVKETCHEVDWVFMGMCLEEIRPYIAEEHPFVPINEYPERMAALSLNLAVAPLAPNEFNQAKSNLRILEYGILGWPVICSEIEPYRGAPVQYVSGVTSNWVNCIRSAVSDLELLEEKGKQLRQWVLDHFLLENHLDKWVDAFLPDE